MMTSACKPSAVPAENRAPGAPGFAIGMRISRTSSAFMGNNEPDLNEIFDDPVILRLMARDGVEVASLRSMLADMRDRLR
jgi:hypothetical protein